MKISLNWLKEYIPGWENESLDSLTDKMVSVGLDVEGVEDQGKIFDKFIIGEVIEKQKHPDADKLSLCKVNIGDRVLSIVCGAPNVETGQKVCVALEKAIIPNGGFEIKKSKIRGEVSEGMICSEKELNMSDKHEGILVLNGEANAGEKFSDYIKANDIVFEIGITPNRGDLFSHIGVAREVAAIYDKKIFIPEINLKESQTPTSDLIKIKIENADLCKRFTGRVIRNVQIKESPSWLQKKLKAIGLRPINNIVDITNFVMFETGQPLHAFDYDKIRGKEIIVKTASAGDKFTTLDSKERVLNSGSLMICDAEGYIGIAGIMGGELSEVNDDTKNIFLESAYFNPVSIRKNSKQLGLQTDASHRFERGIDVDMVKYASLRAAQLISEIAGGEVSKELYDLQPEKFEKIEIGLRLSKANDIIGIEFKDEEIIKLLDKIDINFKKKDNDKLIFQIPEFRRLDIEREIDLIEEIARIYGYDKIAGITNFNLSTDTSDFYKNTNIKLIGEITAHLIGRGFNQVLTLPLIDEKKVKGFSDKIVRLKNSETSDMNSLRTDLIPGMLNVIRNNFNNSGKDISLKLFETGRIFWNNGTDYKEEDRLIIAIAGKRDSELIYGGDKNFDIFEIKGEVEMLLSKLNLENFALIYYTDKDLTGHKIGININNELAGVIYDVNSSLKKRFDIEPEVYLAEIYIDKISGKAKNSGRYKEISKFPPVKRDIAIVVDKNVYYNKIEEIIFKNGSKLLKDLKLFDIYKDEKIGADKKSIAMTLEFSSNEKTLTDEETNKIIDKIISVLEKNLGAVIRA